jgi:hypothetical protein
MLLLGERLGRKWHTQSLLEAFVLLATVSIIGGGGPGKNVRITPSVGCKVRFGWMIYR